MTRRTLIVCATLLGLVAGCGSASSGPASSGPASSGATGASATTAGPIAHATGAADLLFRLSIGGGFAGLETTARVSLYGDGTLIYLVASEPYPSPAASVRPHQPYRVGHLDERQVQAILASAVAALGPARAEYRAWGADYFTMTFGLRAGGLDKRVSADGLLEGGDPPPSDAPTWAALRALLGVVSERAAAIADPAVYAPEAYLGRLSLHLPSVAGVAWPWPMRSLVDFASLPGSTARGGQLSAADVAVLGLPNVEGGFDGLVVTGPDGKAYDLSVRPLLPDEVR